MAVRIPVRRMDFDFGLDIPEAWADGNAMITSLMAGLSAVFPSGERFFIDSVRHYASQVTDPDLKERIRAFIGQEANHTKGHIAFNRFLDTRGFDVWKIERIVEARLKGLRKLSSPEANLARTAALEHMTAMLASAILEDGDFLEHSHPTIAAFWKWHAIEEIEHRSVAFDVYRECVDDEHLRRRMMALVTLLFCTLSALRMVVNLVSSFRYAHSAAGLPLTSTRSATLPGAMEPMRSPSPRNCAPLRVAMRIASTGVKPASTSSSTSRWSP